MGLKTTTIGSYPKPDYVPVKDWFQLDDGMTTSAITRIYAWDLEKAGGDAERLFARATGEAIADQITCGIDVPTDGEMRRENYIHYHCRHLEGFDFGDLTSQTLRDGAYKTELPTVHAAIRPRGERFLQHDYAVAQAGTDRPVKITIPGPLTIADTVADAHYGDPAKMTAELADALNQEIRALADAGCLYIQIDEPLFVRKVEEALAFGIDNLVRCFDGLPNTVTRVMHMCCGYPNAMDQTDSKKADPRSYFDLAKAIDDAPIDQISIEDAHWHNDLSLLERFEKTTVVFGVVAVAKSRVETPEEIAGRIEAALNHIDRDRLWIAPDCGLGFLGRELAMRKLTNMCAAATAA